MFFKLNESFSPQTIVFYTPYLFQNIAYHMQAEQTWNIAWEVLHDNDNWHLETGSSVESGRVYSKTYKDIGRVFKLQVTVHVWETQKAVKSYLNARFFFFFFFAEYIWRSTCLFEKKSKKRLPMLPCPYSVCSGFFTFCEIGIEYRAEYRLCFIPFPIP